MEDMLRRYTVYTNEGEYSDVLARSAEAAKDRVFYITRGRTPKESMIVKVQ